jgi:hypothetical protein
VEVIATDSSYSNDTTNKVEEGHTARIRSFYEGKNKLLRLIFSLLNSFRLIRKAKKKANDVLVVMSDPPFLTFWASILLKDQNWIFWSMDLYPDAFKSSELVSSTNPFYRYLNHVVYSNPPDYLIALGELQSDYLRKKYQYSINQTVLPCGIHDQDCSIKQNPPWKKNDHTIYLGYCGNIGAAHSLDFVKEAIDRSADGNFRFILAVYGEKAGPLKEFAATYNHVMILDHVEKKNLKYIDIHLVTLKKDWEHVCVPSKAVSAICSECTILFCGTQKSDTWNLLGKAGWFVRSENIQEDLKQHLDVINQESISVKKRHAKDLKMTLIQLRQQSFNNISTFISNL